MSGPIAIEDLRWFGLVAEAGGLTEAARQFGISKSTLSRAVARAEACAGAPLFDRTGRGLSLTPLGTQLLPPARDAIVAHREAEETLRVGTDAPAGILRIGAVTVEANRLLAPVLSEMARRHPAVRTELRYSSRALDPVAADLDVCLRVGRPDQPHLITRRVLDARLMLVASPDALLGVDPNDPDEVRALDRVCVSLPSLPLTWTLQRESGLEASVEADEEGAPVVTLDRPPLLTVNDPSTALEVVVGGAGMTFVPGFEIEDRLASGALVPVLPVWGGPRLEVHAVMPPGRTKVPAVRAFLDLMDERARELRKHLARPSLRVVA